MVNISSIYGILEPEFTVYKDKEMMMPAAYAAIKGGVVISSDIWPPTMPRMKYVLIVYNPKEFLIIKMISL